MIEALPFSCNLCSTVEAGPAGCIAGLTSFSQLASAKLGR